jgi:hypothetical protein
MAQRRRIGEPPQEDIDFLARQLVGRLTLDQSEQVGIGHEP